MTFVLPQVMPPPRTVNAATDLALATIMKTMMQNIEDMRTQLAAVQGAGANRFRSCRNAGCGCGYGRNKQDAGCGMWDAGCGMWAQGW